MNELDEIILRYKGKIYLAKDSRLSNEKFVKFYPKNLEKLKNLRKSLKSYFESEQSARINL